MEQATSRSYRRHKRKLACRNCNARHIRCRTPEGTDTEHGDRRKRRCQACQDMNKECIVDTDAGPTASKQTRTTSKTARGLNQLQAEVPAAPFWHGPRALGQMTNVVQNNLVQMLPDNAGKLAKSIWLSNDPAQEGSETLLVKLLDVRDNEGEDSPSKGTNTIMYFGNDSIWSYSLQKARRTKSQYYLSPESTKGQSCDLNIHYNIPDTPNAQPHGHIQHAVSHMKQDQLQLLQASGAFTLPPFEVQKELLDSYFNWVYPLQQILNKEQFLHDFEAGQVSLLLLQALLSVATTCCNESTIQKLCSDRRSAQKAFHQRARALYDADYEQDRITIVQALFCMGYWWESPTDIKDFSHWLSISIHLAQVMGMHRSTKYSSLSLQDRKLWKRIWWSLYVRDHFDASSVGRPMMINDDDCDIEELRSTDFEVEGVYENDAPWTQLCIEMTKLAILIGRVIRAGQEPKDLDDSTDKLDRDLRAWEYQLPDHLKRYNEARDAKLKLYTSMLFFGFHFCVIHLHRKSFLDGNPDKDSNLAAPTSANAVTHIAEELLTDGLIVHAQLHLIAVIFASFSIHVVSMEHSQGSRRRVLQHKARLCLLALAELRNFWPFVDWMYRMFDSLLERLLLEDGSIVLQNETRDEQQQAQSIDLVLPMQASAQSSDALELNMGGPAQVQNDLAIRDQTLPGTGLVENFLDPFTLLDNFDWFDQSAAFFGNIDTQSIAWPGPN